MDANKAATELLPCCKTNCGPRVGHNARWCPAYYRPAIAAKLREVSEQAEQRGREQVATLAAEVERLRDALKVEQETADLCENCDGDTQVHAADSGVREYGFATVAFCIKCWNEHTGKLLSANSILREKVIALTAALEKAREALRHSAQRRHVHECDMTTRFDDPTANHTTGACREALAALGEPQEAL
jgi:hypothetical protein